MQKRNFLNSPRLLELKHKRQKATINKFLYSAILFLILFSIFIYVCRIPRLNIQEIKVTGNKVLDTENMVSYVKSDINGKYFWLIPKSSVFFYSKK
jgi:cell division septal protein FtsQ